MNELEAIKELLHQKVDKLNWLKIKKSVDPVLFWERYDINFQITESELRNKKEDQDEESN